MIPKNIIIIVIIIIIVVVIVFLKLLLSLSLLLLKFRFGPKFKNFYFWTKLCIFKNSRVLISIIGNSFFKF